MLLSKYSFVGLSSINLSYYEKKGYNIPRYKNDKGKLVFKNGTKIKVKTIDLQKNSMIRVFVKCDCCGKEYYITYRDYLKQNNGEKTYCNKCIKYSHVKNGNNKPINDFNKEKNREIFGYTEFVKKVLARDNYTCQCCGQEHGDIEVHHLMVTIGVKKKELTKLMELLFVTIAIVIFIVYMGVVIIQKNNLKNGLDRLLNWLSMKANCLQLGRYIVLRKIEYMIVQYIYKKNGILKVIPIYIMYAIIR